VPSGCGGRWRWLQPSQSHLCVGVQGRAPAGWVSRGAIQQRRILTPHHHHHHHHTHTQPEGTAAVCVPRAKAKAQSREPREARDQRPGSARRDGRNLVRLRDLVGAPRSWTGLFSRLPGRGGHLGEPATKWGGRGRPAGHAAVPPAARR
jgi:hypothetical protein